MKRKRLTIECTEECACQIRQVIKSINGWAELTKEQTEACEHRWRASMGEEYCVLCWADKPTHDNRVVAIEEPCERCGK